MRFDSSWFDTTWAVQGRYKAFCYRVERWEMPITQHFKLALRDAQTGLDLCFKGERLSAVPYLIDIQQAEHRWDTTAFDGQPSDDVVDTLEMAEICLSSLIANPDQKFLDCVLPSFMEKLASLL